MQADDAYYMGLAIDEARRAAAAGEVPVGAVLVRPGGPGQADEILARAHNRPIGLNDPSAHAEMLALRVGAAALGNYRLDGCVLYVTLEPCAMCAQAALHARLARVVYGAAEPKTGAAGSVIDVLGHPALNHHTQVLGGVEEARCRALMQAFFAEQRRKAKAQAAPLRDDALRTPEAAFEPVWLALPGWRAHAHSTWAGHALAGLRLHWMAQRPARATSPAILFLHGPDGWWPQWAAVAEHMLEKGHRVLLPDLIGFGMSDKPKKPRWHTLERHAAIVSEWLLNLEGEEVAGCQIWTVSEQATLAQALCQRLGLDAASCVIQQPALPEGLPPDWRQLPYPDDGHRAALKAWPWPPA